MFKLRLADWMQKQWAGFTPWHFLLIPLSWLFAGITCFRKYLYRHHWLRSYRLDVPVIVVGNINIGGTGKTPVVIWLAEQLKRAGYLPGIVSRGYGGSVKHVAPVLPDSSPHQVGDEAVLIAMRTGCPVYVGSDRVAAGRALRMSHPACNIIISDDGLQHYRLQRDVEIVVYDGIKGFGNEALLPAGPLRESKARLKTVDVIISNGKDAHQRDFDAVAMQLAPADFYNLIDNQLKCKAQAFAQQKVLAIAGIGNPERFFEQLRNMGLDFESRAYVDHHVFQAGDFEHTQAEVVLMTEKDAVKCRAFAKPNFWVLPVSAMLGDDLMPAVLDKLKHK